MAAISSDLTPDEVLGALARNVVTNGYQASHSNDALEQTEYLKLVHRYLSQARELEKLSGESRVITIENCESPKAGELLRILGFRMRGGCFCSSTSRRCISRTASSLRRRSKIRRTPSRCPKAPGASSLPT